MFLFNDQVLSMAPHWMFNELIISGSAFYWFTDFASMSLLNRRAYLEPGNIPVPDQA